MNFQRRTIICLLASLGTFVSAQTNSTSGESFAGKVLTLPITSSQLISTSENSRTLKMLEEAESGNAAAIILDISATAGLTQPTLRVVEKIAASDIPVIAYVRERASGPGAVIAAVCDQIYLHPKAKLGGQNEDMEWRRARDELPNQLTLQTWQAIQADLEAACVTASRSALPVKAFLPNTNFGAAEVRPEIKRNGKTFSTADEILIVTAENAGNEFDEIGVLVSDVADDTSAVAQKAGHSGPLLPLTIQDPAGKKTQTAASVAKTDQAETKKSVKSAGKDEEDDYKGKIVVIEIGQESLMRKTRFDYIRRILEKAEKDGAKAVIFEMNTPGGLAFDTADIMTKDLANAKVRTITWVNPEASSAGSLIAIATDKIYMHQPSTIGSAGVVSAAGDIQGTMRQKIYSLFLSVARGTAENKGHPIDITQAFVDEKFEVTREIPVINSDGSLGRKVLTINPAGEMLNLTASEASQLIDGKPLFADVAQTLEELIEKEGLEGEVVRPQLVGLHGIADILVAWAPLLLTLALAGAYLELQSPGFGIPGGVALVCFALFFFGGSIGGLAGKEEMVLFVLGLILLVVELYIFPGLLIPGLIGIACILSALFLAMIPSFREIEIGQLDVISVITPAARNLVISILGSFALLAIFWRFFPLLPFARQMTLGQELQTGAQPMMPQAFGLTSPVLEVGQVGVVSSVLRPSGRAIFDEIPRDVSTESEFLDPGTRVRIVKIDGMRVVVEKI